MHKFFVSSDAISNSTVVITGTDARHISFSLRMKKGEKMEKLKLYEYKIILEKFDLFTSNVYYKKEILEKNLILRH